MEQTEGTSTLTTSEHAPHMLYMLSQTPEVKPMKHPRKRAVPKKKDSEIRVLVDTNFWFVLFCLDKPDGGGEKFLADSASAMRAYREFAAEDVKVVSCGFQREELLKVSGRLARMFEGEGEESEKLIAKVLKRMVDTFSSTSTMVGDVDTAHFCARAKDLPLPRGSSDNHVFAAAHLVNYPRLILFPCGSSTRVAGL